MLRSKDKACILAKGLLQLCGYKKVAVKLPTSGMARIHDITTKHAFTHNNACPSAFFTISLDDTHEMTYVRPSFHSDKASGNFACFPARRSFEAHLLVGNYPCRWSVGFQHFCSNRLQIRPSR